jgi:hypothetical protein
VGAGRQRLSTQLVDSNLCVAGSESSGHFPVLAGTLLVLQFQPGISPIEIGHGLVAIGIFRELDHLVVVGDRTLLIVVVILQAAAIGQCADEVGRYLQCGIMVAERVFSRVELCFHDGPGMQSVGGG